MFSYVSLGTRDIARARAFYDAVMAVLGHARVPEMEDGRSSAWGVDDPGPHFYAGYVRDPDGNKLNAVCYTPE